MAEYTRKDIHLTSAGVGHHYRPGYYFPSSTFQTTIGEALPAELAVKDEVLRQERFKTTTGIFHDTKFSGGPYGIRDPLYKKAPGHYKIDYVKDIHEKLGQGNHRRPLTMGNQTSETHEQYRAQPDMIPKGKFDPNPQGFVLHSHHTNGPSKQVLPNTQNEKMRGRPFYVRDKGVLNLLDPYLTTTHKDHHAFTDKELKGYPKKDVATYWECENYPKAWGHGLKHNPMPKEILPKEPLPMRDETWFKSKTRIGRIPNSFVPVPHTGMKTLKQESYQQPSDVKMKEIYYCPVDTPYTLPNPGPRTAFSAPAMYRTEYQTVGSGKIITV